MLPDDFVKELKSELRLEFYNYYDLIKNDIDTYTLRTLNDEFESTGYLSNNKASCSIEALNELLINTIDVVCSLNMKEIDDFFYKNRKVLNDVTFHEIYNFSEEDLKKMIIKNYCFYVFENLNQDTNSRLGVLIKTDWLLSSAEKDFIRKNLQTVRSRSTKELELIDDTLTMQFSYRDHMATRDKPYLDIINLSRDTTMKEIAQLQTLNLENYTITRIHPNAFSRFHNLKELDLNSNDLNTLNNEIFIGLTNLEVLRLNDCQIKTIQANCFRPLKNLKLLNLTRNHLNFIYNDLFDGLNCLEKLYLKSCSIQLIKKHPFHNLNNLIELDISNNPITTISDTFFNGLDRLEKLNLTRCQNIKTIQPKALNQMINLKELDLPNIFTDNDSSTLDRLFSSMELVSLETC